MSEKPRLQFKSLLDVRRQPGGIETFCNNITARALEALEESERNRQTLKLLLMETDKTEH